MKLTDKIIEKQTDLYKRKPITCAFLGDSVTQGCYDCYETDDKKIETEFHAEWAYARVFERMMHMLYPSVPFAIINAGISGGSSAGGLARLERDVLSYEPDLVVVCFGLNDSGKGIKGVGEYAEHMRDIFRQVLSSGAECIYMTPNMMNDHVSPKIRNEHIRRFAADFAKRTKEGVMDAYVAAGKAVANECGVPVCDCYAIWKQMAANGVDVTELLANKMNHPNKEMHFLFAYELVKTILS